MLSKPYYFHAAAEVSARADSLVEILLDQLIQKSYHFIKVSTTTMSCITITRQDSATISLAIYTMPKPQITSFLHLPLEIRLQIYLEILYSHPAKHVFLALEPSQDHHTTYTYHPSTHRPRFPQRSVCKLPTSLLLTCRTIYLESRELPFTQCLFTFISQYHSALYCAKTFLSARDPWQRDSIRSIEIETLPQDLFVSLEKGARNNPSDKVTSQFSKYLLHIENLRFLLRGSSNVSVERLGIGARWPCCNFAEMERLKTVEFAIMDESARELAEVAYMFPQYWGTGFKCAMRGRSWGDEDNIEEGDLKQELHLTHLGWQISGK
jgi:hypothetical protein